VDDNKKKALAAALGQIEKQFGKGTIMRMGDDAVARDIDVISTGSLGLDIALGIGGLPRGRIVEIYGPEASGKTTMTLQAIAQCQKAGGTAAFVDAEHGHLRPRPKSKAIWATRTWGCKLASCRRHFASLPVTSSAPTRSSSLSTRSA